MIYVLAGNYIEFNHFCREQFNMSARWAESHRFAKYVNSWQDFRGMRGIQILVYGTADSRRDWDQLYNAAMAVIA